MMTNHDDRIGFMRSRRAFAAGGWMLAVGLLLSLMEGEAFAKGGGGSSRPSRSPEGCQATAKAMLQSCSVGETKTFAMAYQAHC